jgi:ribosomal protein S18 acetylase RimI-like enzyme
MQARRGEVVDVLEGEGAIATDEARPLGLVTWLVATPGDEAEVRALAVDHAARRNHVGAALLAAAEEALAGADVLRAWLVTTNDNLPALALYQKAGWRLTDLRAGAIDNLRQTIKPGIPAVGQGGIPLRDELELAKDL